MTKKLNLYCVSPLPNHLCAMVQTGDCIIDSDWMCPHYILRAIDEIDLYPWWKRSYIKYIYNKYVKNLNKFRRTFNSKKELLEEMEKW